MGNATLPPPPPPPPQLASKTGATAQSSFFVDMFIPDLSESRQPEWWTLHGRAHKKTASRRFHL
jgi:hypothetical protein